VYCNAAVVLPPDRELNQAPGTCTAVTRALYRLLYSSTILSLSGSSIMDNDRTKCWKTETERMVPTPAGS
jgi:hypothetical protein